MKILGERSDLLFSRKSDRKKKKSTVPFTHVQNIICSQTQLDSIAHEQTIICRQLFAGHVVGSRPMKRKKNLLRMIIHLVCPSKLCISIVFNSSGDHCNTQEKLKTKGLYFLCGRGGQTRCIMGEVVIANRSCCRTISTNEVQMLERGCSGKMTPINNF